MAVPILTKMKTHNLCAQDLQDTAATQGCPECSGAALRDACRTVGDGMGFEEEQVFADSDLTFKEDVQQLQDPSPCPEWKRRRKRTRCLRSAVLHGAWWSIQVQQKCQTRAPGSRTPTLALHAPAAVRAAGTCPERQGRHPFLPPARLCSGPVCKVHSAA